MPLRQLAALWSSFQLAMASLDRISEVLALEPNMPQLPAGAGRRPRPGAGLRSRAVQLRPAASRCCATRPSRSSAGKTYALVGPDRRRQDDDGVADGAALRSDRRAACCSTAATSASFTPEERAAQIGFILQEPFLFTGTVRDNIVYGNDDAAARCPTRSWRRGWRRSISTACSRASSRAWRRKVTAGGDGVSLGQKQLIAFMRAVLREPEILILDEATANIDTVTEQLLEQILRELPASTTKVVIAHRLNTIENADEIFFINGGEITPRRLDGATRSTCCCTASGRADGRWAMGDGRWAMGDGRWASVSGHLRTRHAHRTESCAAPVRWRSRRNQPRRASSLAD